MSKNYPLTLGKQTWEQLENIHRFGYSYSTIFSDFLETCLSHLLSLTDNLSRKSFEELKKCKFDGKYEDQYMQIVAKYRENKEREKGKRPADYFAHAWACLQKETHESGQDILGEIFTTQISFGEHGQFFTPSEIVELMTQITYSPSGKAGETVSDPCCGSGRMFISVSKQNKNVHFYGVDLAIVCAKMTALNMWLFDLNADIFHGDSLAMKYFRVWKIRHGGFIYESEIKNKAVPMPDPVKTAIIKQAEQQKLFDLDETQKERR
jgi:type I restriction-modification system DNA methylase subunit